MFIARSNDVSVHTNSVSINTHITELQIHMMSQSSRWMVLFTSESQPGLRIRGAEPPERDTILDFTKNLTHPAKMARSLNVLGREVTHNMTNLTFFHMVSMAASVHAGVCLLSRFFPLL